MLGTVLKEISHFEEEEQPTMEATSAAVWSSKADDVTPIRNRSNWPTESMASISHEKNSIKQPLLN